MQTRNQILKVFLKVKAVSTDTRSIPKGALFFALKGDNFNGNLFAQKALDAGASLVIVDEKQSELKERTFILVENVLRALQELASDYRDMLKATVIGLTGSNGKTTCKELFRDVLKTTYATKATHGNLNNHIGVPLTLLSIPIETEIAIVEMGANHKKEIEFLSNIAKPDIGYITNFGKAHLEGFGGIEGVIEGKSELYAFLEENRKKALVYAGDSIQMERTQHIDRFVFGESSNANCTIKNLKTEQASAIINGVEIKSQLTGSFHFTNIAAAIALGRLLKVDLAKIKTAIENYKPQMNRSEWRQTKSNAVLLDAYNANPDSMLATIDTFADLNKPNKWFILGDMFELGVYAAEEHQKVVDRLQAIGVENAVLIGDKFAATSGKNTFKKFRSTADASVFLQKQKLQNCTILLKGSRGMRLELLLEQF